MTPVVHLGHLYNFHTDNEEDDPLQMPPMILKCILDSVKTKSVGSISHLHLAKSPKKAFLKGRTVQKKTL